MGKQLPIGCYATAEEAALHAARARAHYAQAVISDEASRNQSEAVQKPPDLLLQATATPVPEPYACAASFTRPRGSRIFQFDPSRCIVILPGPVSTHPSLSPVATAIPLDSDNGQNLPLADASVISSAELLSAAANLVDQASKLMDPGVLRLLQGKREARVQVCVEVLRRNQTLALSRCASGCTQVRVIGPSGKGDIKTAVRDAENRGLPLRFTAARVFPPTTTGGTRQTVHGEIYDLPELAASDLAIPLEYTLPLPPSAYNDSSISNAAQVALNEAVHYGLTLQRAATTTGFSGVIHNADKGGGKESAKPYRVRVCDVSTNKRCFASSWSSAEEAALERAKLLRSGKYK